MDTDERCVENIASLRALPGGVASCITLLGYYGPGDGGGGAFFWDPASSDADDGGIVIKPATVTGAGRWRRVYHQPVNVLWFGAVPYTTEALAAAAGAHDSLPALNAAVQSAGGAAATVYDLVGEILIPAGFYNITSAWRISRPIKVRGEGRENGTTLVLTGGHFTSAVWQPNHAYRVDDVVRPTADAEHMFKVWQVTGPGTSSGSEPAAWPVAEYGDVVDEPNVRWKYIGLNYHSGIELETPPPPRPSANYSTISDLNLQPHVAGSSNIAIRANASNVVLDNIFVLNWGLYGFCIDGTSESEPSGRGNANSWRMISCKADVCGTGLGRGAGLFIRGKDSNAGCSVGFSALGSYEGIRDHSFLGNYHYGAHVEASPSYPYWTVSGGVQQSLFLGCYAESPRGPRICPGSAYLGTSSGDFEPDGNGLFGTIISGGSTWPMRFDKQMGTGLDRMSLQVGSNPGSGVESLIGWRAEELTARDIDITENYGIVFSSGRGAWQLRRHGYTYDFAVPFEIVGYGNERFPTQLGVPNLLIGWDNRRVRLTTGRVGGGPPDYITRYWKGDTFFDANPSANGPKFWTCVTPGAITGTGVNSWAPRLDAPRYTFIYPAPRNGFAYEAKTTGTTGATQPVWPTSYGATVVDGDVTWRCVGSDPPAFVPTGPAAGGLDVKLASTAATTLATYSPPVLSNYLVHLYYRVTGAPTNLTIEVSWTDRSGAQTNLAVNGAQAVGSHTVRPIFVNADAGTTITVTATAGAADRVYVSSSIAGA